MNPITLYRNLFGKEITVIAYPIGDDLHVSLFGGDKAHIGAVSMVLPDGTCKTEQFPGHKEGVVSEKWAKTLGKINPGAVIAEAGIHYDNLDRNGINAVLALSDELLQEVSLKISGFQKFGE